jgi:hypothetical protein
MGDGGPAERYSRWVRRGNLFAAGCFAFIALGGCSGAMNPQMDARVDAIALSDARDDRSVPPSDSPVTLDGSPIDATDVGVDVPIATDAARDVAADTSPPVETPPCTDPTTPVDPDPTVGRYYFVDPSTGRDTNPGTAAQPWATFNHPLAHDDVVHLKCGTRIDGGVRISSSGTAGHPITIRTYGTGARPILRNCGSCPDPDGDGRPGFDALSTLPNYQSSLVVTASYIVIDGLEARDAPTGVRVEPASDTVTVRRMVLTNLGEGIWTRGPHALVELNDAHDLQMKVNTAGGNDDSGAVGYVVSGSFAEIRYNRCVRCRAPSYDYGFDGGVVEIYANTSLDDVHIHHNYGQDSEGFTEIGGNAAMNPVLSHLRFHHNVSWNDSSRFFGVHTRASGATFGIDVRQLFVENNTVVQSPAMPDSSVIAFFESPATIDLSVRNNLIVTNHSVYNPRVATTFVHDHNVYVTGTAPVGVTLTATEQSAPSAGFVNLAGGDFHLLASSPAVDRGANLGYLVDYDGTAIPVGAAPDIGAYERH